MIRTRCFKVLLFAISVTWVLGAMPPAVAQDVSAPPASPAQAAAETDTSAVTIWGRTIVTYRLPLEFNSVDDRAAAAGHRVSGILHEIRDQPIAIQPVQVGRGRGLMLTAGPHFLLSIMEGDLGPEGAPELQRVAETAAEEIRTLVRDHAEQSSFALMLRAGIQSVVATVVFAAFWLLVVWLRARLLRRVRELWQGAGRSYELFGYDWRPILRGAIVSVARILLLAAVLTGGYLWLTFVLGRFPYTRHWGDQLGDYLLKALGGLAAGAAHEIPNLIALIVIYLVTRGVIRLFNAWFLAIESGKNLNVWLDPEAARATRRLTDIGVWIVAVVVAFPYLPGSHSEAFRGVSVFVALIVSLGGAGFVGQIIGGLAAVYSRAVRSGDYIRVGDIEGTVKELGMFSTKLTTRTREEVTLPNSMLTNSPVRNFSRVNGNVAAVTTAVTIGYDTPWRQVHAMLLAAAAKTDGVARDPQPRVLQTALDDFYVRYELNLCTESAYVRAETLARLHANIQDIFNEHGVQIMSPHFRDQPDVPVVVPKDRWVIAPAQPAEAEKS